MEAIDTQIEKLFNIVRAQKKEVEEAESLIKKKWLTNCAFRGISATTTINIQTATADQVTRGLTELLMVKSHAQEAAKLLGMPDITHDGFDFEDWIQDFQKRMTAINLKSKKEKLKELESRLTAIISPEQKRKMELIAIQNELGADNS